MSGNKNQAISLAEKLTKNPENKEEFDNYNENLFKGLKIYKDICMSRSLPAEDKLNAIVSFNKAVPDEGLDMLCRWRDMLPFLKGSELEEQVKLMVFITRCPELDSHQRVVTAVTLYNRGFIGECYKCFADLACDRSVLVNYRVESSRYLFATEDDEDREIAQEALVEIIESEAYPSEYRYKVIAGFISRTGINTTLNMTKLEVPYDEEFVYGLQTIFFYNPNNGIRERILSGQHMLQMLCVPKEEKESVGEELLEISSNKELSHEIRADAADVVFREGTIEQRVRAREIITDLGYSTVDQKGQTGSFLENTRTVYMNAENVHAEEIAKSVGIFIEKLVREKNFQTRPYHEVHQEVASLVGKTELESEQRHSALKALNRVSVDTAVFTKYKATIAEIFVNVWSRIKEYANPEIRQGLEKRMVEELIDMGETCSSGHSARFVNVLSDVDPSLKIGWEDQIIANMAGRMDARIRDYPDENIRAGVALGMMKDADQNDREIYVKFVKDQLIDLKQELRREFVGAGYIKEDEFEDSFQKGVNQFEFMSEETKDNVNDGNED